MDIVRAWPRHVEYGLDFVFFFFVDIIIINEINLYY
jgi:hypothetical protein